MKHWIHIDIDADFCFYISWCVRFFLFFSFPLGFCMGLILPISDVRLQNRPTGHTFTHAYFYVSGIWGFSTFISMCLILSDVNFESKNERLLSKRYRWFFFFLKCVLFRLVKFLFSFFTAWLDEISENDIEICFYPMWWLPTCRKQIWKKATNMQKVCGNFLSQHKCTEDWLVTSAAETHI